MMKIARFEAFVYLCYMGLAGGAIGFTAGFAMAWNFKPDTALSIDVSRTSLLGGDCPCTGTDGLSCVDPNNDGVKFCAALPLNPDTCGGRFEACCEDPEPCSVGRCEFVDGHDVCKD